MRRFKMIKEKIISMCDGNPGALRVLMDISQIENGIPAIMLMDTAGLKGCKVWLAYKDVCLENYESLIAWVCSDQLPRLIVEVEKANDPITHGRYVSPLQHEDGGK
jgi:hypothetical protein